MVTFYSDPGDLASGCGDGLGQLPVLLPTGFRRANHQQRTVRQAFRPGQVVPINTVRDYFVGNADRSGALQRVAQVIKSVWGMFLEVGRALLAELLAGRAGIPGVEQDRTEKVVITTQV